MGLPRAVARFIYHHALLLSFPFILILLFFERWLIFGFIGGLVLFGLRWIGLGRPLPHTPINLPLLGLLACLALSFRLSPTPNLALSAAAKVYAGVVLLFVLYDHVQSAPDLWRVAAGVALLGLGLALLTPFSVQWMSDKVFGLDVFYSQTWLHLTEPINPNKFAAALAPLVPIALALLGATQPRWRTLGAIALPPMLVILVLLQSRGALVAVVGGVLALFILARRWVLLTLTVVALVVGIMYINSTGLAAQEVLSTANPRSALLSIDYRFQLWQQAMPLVLESPIVGTGLAAYPVFAQARFPKMLGEYEFSHAHNVFLQVALDTGILGLVCFVALLIMAILITLRAFRSDRDRSLAIGILASFVVLLIHNLIDQAAWATRPGIIFWIILALAVSLAKSQQATYNWGRLRGCVGTL